jgi:hypothetical protein
MPLAIVDGGRKIRRTISRRTEIAARFRPAAARVTSSANRSLAASEAATPTLPTTTGSTAPMEASDSTPMETASATAMETAAAPTAMTTATTVLSVGCVWGKSETTKYC